MKIKMLVAITGTIDGRSWPDRGDEITLADHVAEDLISNKFAVEVKDVETSSIDPVAETAAKPTAKPRKV